MKLYIISTSIRRLPYCFCCSCSGVKILGVNCSSFDIRSSTGLYSTFVESDTKRRRFVLQMAHHLEFQKQSQHVKGGETDPNWCHSCAWRWLWSKMPEFFSIENNNQEAVYRSSVPAIIGSVGRTLINHEIPDWRPAFIIGWCRT